MLWLFGTALAQTFAAPVDIGVMAADSVQGADLDGDGHLEVVASRHHYGGGLSIFRPSGATWSLDYIDADEIVRPSMLDWDDDGTTDLITDIACTDSSDFEFVWLQGPTLATLDDSGCTPTNSTSAGDVDCDGRVDLLRSVGDYNGTYSAAEADQLLLNGAGLTHTPLDIPGAYDTRDIDVADVDGDGDQDLLRIDQGNLRWVEQLSGGQLVDQGVLATGGYFQQVMPGDFDVDGWPDVALLDDPLGLSDAIVVLRNQGAVFTEVLRVEGEVVDAAWGDIDCDDDLDLAVGSNLGVAIWRNDGTAGFVEVPVSTEPVRALALVDVDGDSAIDLVFGGDVYPQTVRWMRNEAGCAPVAQLPSCSSPRPEGVPSDSADTGRIDTSSLDTGLTDTSSTDTSSTDTSSTDSGTLDTGTTATDETATTDTGAPSQPASACGCQGSPSSLAWLAPLSLVFLRRRRSRRLPAAAGKARA